MRIHHAISTLLALVPLGACMSSPEVGTGAGSGSSSSGATQTNPVSDLVCGRKMALDLTHNAIAADDVGKLERGELTLSTLADQYLASPEFEAVAFDWMRSEFPP